MSDFQIFGYRSTGNDVLVNVDHISSVQQVYAVHGEEEQATLYMVDGSKIDLCDFWESVVERLTTAGATP
jgi:hypothetical protein